MRVEIAAEGGLNKHTPNNLLWKLVRAGLVESRGQSAQRSSSTVSSGR